MERNIEERNLINNLIELYGDLISENYLDKLRLYYVDDLSLSEIAEICKISRSGVLDAISNGEKALINYEEKLHLLVRKQNILELLNQLRKINIDDAVCLADKIEEELSKI